MTINDIQAIPENLVVVHNILNFKEISLTFLILCIRRINEVRFKNFVIIAKHFIIIASNSGENTG